MLPEDFEKILAEGNGEIYFVDIPDNLTEELFLSLKTQERYRKALHAIINGEGLSKSQLRQIARGALEN